jgi:hypothetical protein
VPFWSINCRVLKSLPNVDLFESAFRLASAAPNGRHVQPSRVKGYLRSMTTTSYGMFGRTVKSLHPFKRQNARHLPGVATSIKSVLSQARWA